jgi:hypothetical protein
MHKGKMNVEMEKMEMEKGLEILDEESPRNR